MKYARRTLAALLLAACAPALASDRVIVYPLQNPLSTQQSLMQRYPRVQVGNFMRDAFGSVGSIGGYTNMSIAPAGTLYVSVSPTSSTNNGALYQLEQNDPNPIPQNVTPQLAADPTVVMLEGILNATSSLIGPIAVPGTTGQSQYTLIEAQIQSADTNSQQELFVNQAGGKYYATVNTDRTDQIVFQAKAGTASTTPSIPTTDAGWVSIGTVLVPYGTSTITSGMINMVTPFPGFLNADTVTASATAATGTINYYSSLQKNLYYTSNATGNFTLNVAASNSSTLNSVLPIGGALTVNFLNSNGSTPYYCSGVQIDGTSSGVTTIWQGGSAPVAGNASSVDQYTLKILKTASATYTVLATLTKF